MRYNERVMFIRKPNESFDPEKHFDTVPLYQGLFFRRWQERYGRAVVSLIADDTDNTTQAFVQCVEYTLPVIGSVWVAAQGPIGAFSTAAGEEAFYRELCALCTDITPKISHIRVQRDTGSVRSVRAERCGGSFTQPFMEEVIALERDLEDIISDFAGNTRRKVRRYERGQCEDVRFHIEQSQFSKHLQAVHTLLAGLASSKKFNLHPYAYYEALFAELDARPACGVLVLGYLEGNENPVSFVLGLRTGPEVYHLYSATAAAGYEYDMPTIAHYITLKHAKEQGATTYNLGGTDSASSRSIGNLAAFKKKFGGKQITYPDSYDVVVSRRRYYLFRFLRLRWVLAVRRIIVRLYKKVEVELQAE